MPRITLSDGRTALISVRKDTVIIKKSKKDIARRRVSAKLIILQPLKEGQEKADAALDKTAEVICSEKDQFNPKFGRQEAVRRLLKIVGDGIARSDREKIIKTLCPEFFITKIDRIRAEFNRLKNILQPVDNIKEKVA